MPAQSYLWQLTTQLAEGLARLPEETRTRHAIYLRATQNPDGGVSGREGDSDLYYTAFALRGLAVLGALTPETAERAAGYLRRCLAQHATVIDLFSLLYAGVLVQASGGPDILADSPADWPERVASTLETFRTKDGGYGKTIGAASGSTYHSFLVALCYQLLGRGVPRPEEVLRFVASRRREDGGFVEIGPMRRSGTNPTAAGVGIYQLLADEVPGAALDADTRTKLVEFLAAMPSMEGGLRANDRAPLADLLSTFTGSWTLQQLGALDRLERASVLEFVESLELPTGGFRGGLWDARTDVEYTFYGLGCLALFA
jgi:geranylgeranyl transferase type-2 subunit beta